MMAISDHKSIVNDIIVKVKSLSDSGELPGITSADIIGLQIPSDEPAEVESFPAIIVCAFGEEAEDSVGARNKSEIIDYPVLVAVIDDSGSNSSESDLDKRLLWREKLLDQLARNRNVIQSVTGVLDTSVEPASIIDPASWFSNSQFVSAFVVKVSVIKKR